MKILCLLNDLGHEGVVNQYVPGSTIIMIVTVWTAALPVPGHVSLNGIGEINLFLIFSKASGSFSK